MVTSAISYSVYYVIMNLNGVTQVHSDLPKHLIELYIN